MNTARKLIDRVAGGEKVNDVIEETLAGDPPTDDTDDVLDRARKFLGKDAT